MAKKKRRAFPVNEPPAARRRDHYPVSDVIDADDPGFGVFGWFRNPGVRETIESVVIAILLAFMFKTYEAEAFVIPTGSMAPSLQGQHMDHDCAQCGHRFLSGYNIRTNAEVEKTICPICNFRTQMRPVSDQEHRPNSGDRILVNKFIYDFHEPERYDVIVFKYPNNAKQNYIKRLIGLPGDNILIENGDIYLMHGSDEAGWEREISRKPSAKVKQVLIEVEDTKYVSGKLKTMDWPSRWAQWDGGNGWKRNANEDKFVVTATPLEHWLRYRHFVPPWSEIERKDGLPARFEKPLAELPLGSLISDSMCYNNTKYKGPNQRTSTGIGNHWVGDLGVEMWTYIESSTGEMSLDLVEGGVHFTCRFDVATGKATIDCADPSIEFYNESGNVAKPVAETSLSPGSNQVLMVNADDQIHLWVNGSLVKFDASTYRRSGKMPLPKYSVADPGDSEPVGVGAKDLAMTVSRLKVVRDIYYSSLRLETQNINERNWNESGEDPSAIRTILQDPLTWSTPSGLAYFNIKRNQTKPMFHLEYGETRDKDQFFPMGDNSTQSLDARVWSNKNRYVERDLLIGRAIYVYWPHPLNEPIPFFPNFAKMKFIR